MNGYRWAICILLALLFGALLVSLFGEPAGESLLGE